MEEYNKSLIEKIIKMFRPCDMETFGPYKKDEVICGPNDRALFGFDTYFPKEWLMQDYGFTSEEVDWFIKKVNELSDE